MESNQPLTEAESLALIHKMIHSAKKQFEDNGFFYLLWGWFVFIACISNYVLLKINFEYNWIGWMILMPLGGVISFFYGRKESKKQQYKSYLDEVMMYVLGAFAFSLFFVLFFMNKLGLETYPMVMVVYGIWLFISGGAMKFKPLILGGVINWSLACIAMFVNFESQLILLSAAVLFGYIVPGYMLRSKFTKENNLVNS
ncbi:MAG: hypothetical protein IPJ66_01950 [Bacteroidetes bacterium]|nr:hypothetical protein [Bacteroidota bacterium]MBL0064468.1 hypothetical protein [Bacteroidota bacterium]MBL0137607.1 hypothetical protein [Bacteroidota bacterium]